GEDGALDGVVGRLGAAGGEDDLVGPGADEGGDAGAGRLDGVVGESAGGVGAGGVAVVFGQVGKHRLDDGGVDRRRGVAVEVDRLHRRRGRERRNGGGRPPPRRSASARAATGRGKSG